MIFSENRFPLFRSCSSPHSAGADLGSMLVALVAKRLSARLRKPHPRVGLGVVGRHRGGLRTEPALRIFGEIIGAVYAGKAGQALDMLPQLRGRGAAAELA